MDDKQEILRLLEVSVREHDEVKALLIQMRDYIINHDLLMGECVAWDKLKRKFGVRQSSRDADHAWLRRYEQAA